MIRLLALAATLGFTSTLVAQSVAQSDELQVEVFGDEGAELEAIAGATRRVQSYIGGLRSCLPEGDGPWDFQIHLDARGRSTSIEFAIVGANRPCIERALLRKRISRRLGQRVRLQLRPRGDAVDVHPLGRGGGSGEGTIGIGNLGMTDGRDSNQGNGYGRGATMRSGPQVQMGRITMVGALDRDVVRRVMRRYLNQVRYCYERALVAQPSLAGAAVVRFIIAATGNVTTADVRDGEEAMEPVARCLSAAMRRWSFPAPAGGGIVIASVRFQFQPG